MPRERVIRAPDEQHRLRHRGHAVLDVQRSNDFDSLHDARVVRPGRLLDEEAARPGRLRCFDHVRRVDFREDRLGRSRKCPPQQLDEWQ